jgi:tRNA-modifying protein YgfZ
MTSKTNCAQEALDSAPITGVLNHMAVLEVVGAEAAAFLQRQCMNDVNRLDRDGAMQWSGLLSAKGRVLFLFRLLRLAADRFLLLAPAADAAALLGELRRYVLRSKLRLVADGWQVLGTVAAAAPDPHALAWDAGRWIDLHDLTGTAPLAADAAAARHECAWIDLDLARGIPHVSAALSDRFTPHMLGLAKLGAFSLGKGCYPGQEIVARTHYLGQQKREWMPLRAPRALRVDEPVLGDGRELGRILQAAPGDPRLGAAVLPIDAAATLQLEDGSLLEAQRASAG